MEWIVVDTMSFDDEGYTSMNTKEMFPASAVLKAWTNYCDNNNGIGMWNLATEIADVGRKDWEVSHTFYRNGEYHDFASANRMLEELKKN